MIDFKEAGNVSDLGSLEADWLQLQESSDDPNIFQSYQWVSLWWKHFSAGKRLRVIFAWEDGVPVLAAPLFFERCRIMGMPVRRITAIGNDISSDHGFLTGRDSAKALENCFNRLCENMKDWDLVELRKIPQDGPVIRTMRTVGKQKDFNFIELPSNRHHYLNVEGSYEEFIKNTASKKLRKTLRNRLNRLKKAGALRFLHEDVMVPEQTYDEIMYLAEQSWKHRAGIDPLARDANRDFFKEAMVHFHDQKLLSLTAMELNGKKVAFDLSFVLGETFFAYYSVFDESLHNLSPGKIIMAHMVERSFANGVKEMDFSEGEEEYKLEWSKSSHDYQEAYLLNRKSPVYPLLLSGLLLRKKIKSSPYLHAKILKLKKRLRKH